MELKKENSNKINILDEVIFESLTEGWDQDYKNDEVPPYLKEIRLVIIGNVDSGKSTLVGCLTKGIKDDGRGYEENLDLITNMKVKLKELHLFLRNHRL